MYEKREREGTGKRREEQRPTIQQFSRDLFFVTGQERELKVRKKRCSHHSLKDKAEYIYHFIENGMVDETATHTAYVKM